MTAEGRAGELMRTHVKKLPVMAYKYANYLAKQMGGGGEVFFMAFCHYAQCVEGLPVGDKKNRADKKAKEWFYTLAV